MSMTACSTVGFDMPGAIGNTAFGAANPFYAEFCAVSQIKKRPGFGADIRGEIGGHAVFYLQGACRDPGAAYPVLQLCLPGQEDGVGISMNAHFRNAKWVATPGHDFFFSGALPPGGLTRAGYGAVQAEAKRRRIYDGIAFHEEVFEAMPAGWSREDWKYEVSASTDYAIDMGRGRHCARVPVLRAQMARMIAFLNDQNAPYRAGQVFHWSIFRDNCIHLAHNALAAAGLWDALPINRPIGVAVFDFPVPRNEFVNLVRRTNDGFPGDPASLDAASRASLLQWGRLPMQPGALAYAAPPRQPNEVYETALKMIFYDEPVFGHYQAWSDAIFQDPRYSDPVANAAWFGARYREARTSRRPLAWWQAHGHGDAGFAAVYAAYYALVDRSEAP